MTAWQAYTRIIIPQVLRIVYHPITNQMVWAVLMSSLGMLVGFRELSGETQFFASRTFRIFEYFAVTAVLYYVIVKIILLASRLLAIRLVPVLRQGRGYEPTFSSSAGLPPVTCGSWARRPGAPS
jgi:ABC-type amino acid transport system permease subunit